MPFSIDRPIGIIKSHKVNQIFHAQTGFCGWSAKAEITDRTGSIRTVFIKAYRPESTSLAGEVCRWMLGASLRIDQPAEAWLVQAPVECWEALFPEAEWREMWGDLVPCFATSEMPGEPFLVAEASNPDIRRQLIGWPGLLPTIALDEWGANDDGNIGNLFEVVKYDGSISFATVDGGRWLGGDNWTVESLERLRPDRRRTKVYNKLMRATLGPILRKSQVEQLKSIAKRHRAALEGIEHWLLRYMVEMFDDFRLASAALETMRARADLTWLGGRYAHS